MAAISILQLPPLTRQSMTELVDKAKRKGLDPGDYAKKLIEAGLAFEREAETSSFAEIMKPVRAASGHVDEGRLTKLVDLARTQHHAGSRRKKR